MGNDPPGQFTRVLHPRHGRHGMPPPDVIPIGRSVIVPANGTLPNIILSPRSFFRIRDALEREQFDVVHLHEPMTPTPCVATLAVCTAPMVGTFHANGDLGWMRYAKPAWGFLADRLDHRIAVSERALESARALAARATTRSSRTACSSRRTPIRPGASTASSSPAATRTARDCTSCCRRGPRSAGAPARRSASAAPTRSRVRLLMTRLRVAGRRHRRARLPAAGAVHRGAARGEGARRAVARRRELRDRADARARVRDARCRLRHPRVP